MEKRIVVGVDPGNTLTAVVIWDGQKVLYKTKSPNDQVRNWILSELDSYNPNLVVVEGIQSFGMAVGASVFDTCEWLGNFISSTFHTAPKLLFKVKRNRIKIHHCGSTKSNDSAIRSALIQRLGEPGTKGSPGVTYGVVADMWSALALSTWGHDVLTNGAPRQDKKGKKK